MTALASFCFLFNSPNFLATRPLCTSKGQDSSLGEIFCQIPKSTFSLGFLTIHLKNILSLLAAEPFKGSETCLVVLCSCGMLKKIVLNRLIFSCRGLFGCVKKAFSRPSWCK